MPRILVPMDFSPCSDGALAHALEIADSCDAEVEIVYVWTASPKSGIFADSPQGIAMEKRLSAACESSRVSVSGRLEFGDEPAEVILGMLDREHFDLVVLGREREPGPIATNIARTARCQVVTIPPRDEEAA
jgi:nucleotide-binding universal stress UspA family protein